MISSEQYRLWNYNETGLGTASNSCTKNKTQSFFATVLQVNA